jgi:hypothetical protein
MMMMDGDDTELTRIHCLSMQESSILAHKLNCISFLDFEFALVETSH